MIEKKKKLKEKLKLNLANVENQFESSESNISQNEKKDEIEKLKLWRENMRKLNLF